MHHKDGIFCYFLCMLHRGVYLSIFVFILALRAARLTKIIIVDYSLEIVIAIINNDYFELGLCDMTIYISDGRNKVYRFILCSIVYFVVSQSTLFTVILFHHLDDCDLYTPPRDVKGRQKQVENDQN